MLHIYSKQQVSGFSGSCRLVVCLQLIPADVRAEAGRDCGRDRVSFRRLGRAAQYWDSIIVSPSLPRVMVKGPTQDTSWPAGQELTLPSRRDRRRFTVWTRAYTAYLLLYCKLPFFWTAGSCLRGLYTSFQRTAVSTAAAVLLASSSPLAGILLSRVNLWHCLKYLRKAGFFFKKIDISVFSPSVGAVWATKNAKPRFSRFSVFFGPKGMPHHHILMMPR